MNLLFCVFKYFPYGGMQRSLIAIAKECQKRGHQITLCALSWEGEIPEGFNLTLAPSKSLTNHGRAKDFAEFVATQKQYDLIIGFNKIPGLDIYYAGDPCLKEKVLQQKSWLYQLTPRYRLYAKFEEAVFAKGSKTHILLVAETEKKHFIQHYGTESERFHLLPPGISRDRIPPPSPQPSPASGRGSTKILLFVGSGFKTKGLDRAIFALASLKIPAKLIVIGKDNPKPFLKLAKNVDVEFLGGREDILNFLLNADVLIHPAYKENTGNILLEAMIAGLPVLTTDTCGYSHYVLEANAGKVIISPFQQEMLNQYLAEMLVSSERETWKKNGMQLAYTHDLFSRAEKAVDIIEHYNKRGTNR